MINFKESHFEKEIILWAVRWYVAYPISYRHLKEMMQERGVDVDHSTLNRWFIKYASEFETGRLARLRPPHQKEYRAQSGRSGSAPPPRRLARAWLKARTGP